MGSKPRKLRSCAGNIITRSHKLIPIALSFQPNHLLSAPPVFLKLFFHNTADLQTIRRDLLPLARSNSEKFTAVDAYADVVSAEAAANGHGDDENRAWGAEDDTKKKKDKEPSECIIEVREHDLAYHLRVAIDLSELFTPHAGIGADITHH